LNLSFLIREITFTIKTKQVTIPCDFNVSAYVEHIPANSLEIDRWHRGHSRHVHRWNFDLIFIDIKKFESEFCARLFRVVMYLNVHKFSTFDGHHQYIVIRD